MSVDPFETRHTSRDIKTHKALRAILKWFGLNGGADPQLP